MLLPLITLVVATAATAAVVTTAAATAAVVAAAAAATVESAAAAAIFARFSFLYNDGTAIEFLVVQAINCGLCFLVIGHFDKTETFGFSCEFVRNDLYGIHRSILLKSILKVHLLSVEV